MDTANLNGKLKIYCPTHQSVFEVEEKPQIICEIVEHSISDNFPHSEFWEYCCDCQTFSPSKFGTGGKAESACPHCERATAKRFLCDECKIAAYDSGKETKGKSFSISAKDGSQPTCAGCRKSFIDAKIYHHKCSDIDALFLTNRANCPFCQKPILIQPAPPPMVEQLPTDAKTVQLDNQIGSTQCANCGHWGRADRVVCGKCGTQINALGAGVVAGTSSPKTQLLGSICPNCGSGNDADSVFCPSCGQALKTAQQSDTIVTPTPPIENPPTPPVNPPPTTSRLPVFLALGGIIVFVFIVVIAYNANNSTSANYTTYGNTSSKTPQTNSSIRNNSDYSNTNKMNDYKMDDKKMSDSTSSPDIGRTGRLTTNLNIRCASNKYSEIIGTHYQDARVEVLEVDSYTANDGEYVTWYKVKILENGYDVEAGNGKGNNWERAGDFGWLEAAMVGWMNYKYISLN